jgi:hypothetical protein
MKCKYCKTYWDVPLRHREGINRKCPFKQEYVSPEEKICNLFTKSTYFFCEKGDQFLAIVCCTSRRDKKMNGCVDCHQGKEVSYVGVPTNKVILRKKI